MCQVNSRGIKVYSYSLYFKSAICWVKTHGATTSCICSNDERVIDNKMEEYRQLLNRICVSLPRINTLFRLKQVILRPSRVWPQPLTISGQGADRAKPFSTFWFQYICTLRLGWLETFHLSNHYAFLTNNNETCAWTWQFLNKNRWNFRKEHFLKFFFFYSVARSKLRFKTRRFIHEKWVKAAAIVLALMGLSQRSAYAIDTTTVNEKWGEPTVAYGGGLSEAQISKLLNY